MSLRDRLFRFKLFGGMLLFCLPPPPSCFLIVCLSTLLAGDLKFFFPLTTFATSGTANSNKSAFTRFAAVTTCFLKNGIAVLQLLAQEHQNHVLFGVQYLCIREVHEC